MILILYFRPNTNACQKTRDRFGAIGILINNAGTDIVGPMDVMTIEDYDDLMKLHFWAPLYTTYAVLPDC